MTKSQSATPQTDQPVNAVNVELLSVTYWRKRFQLLALEFPSLPKIQDKLGPLDADFAHGTGYMNLKRLSANKGRLELTAKAVGLMEQVLGTNLPPDPSPPDPLKRQGLVKKN